MGLFRIQIGKRSKKGLLIDPIDFVVNANTEDICVVNNHYNDRYGGFCVEVFPIQSVNVTIAEEKTVTTRYVKSTKTLLVYSDEKLLAQYMAKEREFIKLEHRLKDEVVKLLLENNPHLHNIQHLELVDVDEKTVKVDIEATLKDAYIVENKVIVKNALNTNT